MQLPIQMAKHIRELHFGGNWTDSNLKDQLEGLTWQEATTHIPSFNTIAELVFHINYYVNGQRQALEQGRIDISDQESFNLPKIEGEADWNALLYVVWNDAEQLSSLVENLPESKMDDFFIDKKYGTYYENFQGLIEHSHYHLGQLVMMKKLIRLTIKK